MIANTARNLDRGLRRDLAATSIEAQAARRLSNSKLINGRWLFSVRAVQTKPQLQSVFIFLQKFDANRRKPRTAWTEIGSKLSICTFFTPRPGRMASPTILQAARPAVNLNSDHFSNSVYELVATPAIAAHHGL